MSRLADTYENITISDNTTRWSHQQTTAIPKSVHYKIRTESMWKWWYPEMRREGGSARSQQWRICSQEN